MKIPRKGMKRPRENMTRPREVEIECMRQEMHSAASGLVLTMIFFVMQLFVPQRRHVLLPNLITLAIIITLQLGTWYPLKTSSGYHQTKRAHQINSAIHHMGRTLSHIIWIVLDNDDMLMRLGLLFLGPCAATRHSRHRTFIAYLAIHTGLTCWRFAGSLEQDWPLIIASASCCHTLYEISAIGQRAEESALEKLRLLVILTEDIADAVLECFCDATARMSEGLEMLQDSPSLSAFLGRRVFAGRCFTNFMYIGDREKYRGCIHQHQPVSEETYTSGGADEVDHVAKFRLWSTDLHLEDSMHIPIEVNVFHARLTDLDEQPFYLIGISEREFFMRNQEMNKKKKQASARGRGLRKDMTDPPGLDFRSGSLAPSRPAFMREDLEEIETLRRRTRDLEQIDTRHEDLEQVGTLQRSFITPEDAPQPTFVEGGIMTDMEDDGHPERMCRVRRPG